MGVEEKIFVQKSHVIKLYPTKTQEVFFRKSCGIARYSYNWALAKWIELRDQGVATTAYSLMKLQNSIKKDQMPFFKDVCKSTPQQAIAHMAQGFKRFFDKKSRFPRFKKKGRKDSFVSVENAQSFKQKDFKLWVPRLGWVKCAENLRFNGVGKSVTIKRIANMWFASINIEVPKSIPALKQLTGENQAIVGVDLGISNMMVCSDGTVYENPRALKSNLMGLKRLHRSMDRKLKGSKNRYKAKMRLAKKYYRVSCIRSNAIHQATTAIVKKYDKIVIETLNVEGMMKNRRLAHAVSDVSFSEISRQLTYKCAWAGKELVKADMFYPSTKTCSGCGAVRDIKLSERVYKCGSCGLEIDRDLNAAINLANYSPTLKNKGREACGEGSSVVATQHSPSMKQEIFKIFTK